MNTIGQIEPRSRGQNYEAPHQQQQLDKFFPLMKSQSSQMQLKKFKLRQQLKNSDLMPLKNFDLPHKRIRRQP